MLPSLTAVARRRPPRRASLAAAGALLVGLAIVLSPHAGAAPAPVAVPSIAEGLPPGTWAMSIPTSWLSAPIAGLHPGDRLDVIALRPGERAAASAIAFDLLVVSADERTVVIASGADDVTALGVARANGSMLVPLLRSTR
jgi:Flp pilus assembly protein CpaB